MRHFAFLSGVFLIMASSAAAQVKLEIPRWEAKSVAATLTTGAPPTDVLYAFSPVPVPAMGTPGPGGFAASAPAEPPQDVYGVFQSFEWQAYAGYTFFRFYELPNVTENLNGFNVSMAYFPRGRWVAADGEFVAAFGSQAGVTSKFILGLGGLRLRWSAPRAVELWAHGLAGGSHFTPQTPFGGQSAFAYEVGGGIDFNAHHHRTAYRLQADVVGTRHFGTYQYSPKISAGIVYRF